jgi:hypothetical protein
MIHFGEFRYGFSILELLLESEFSLVRLRERCLGFRYLGLALFDNMAFVTTENRSY